MKPTKNYKIDEICYVTDYVANGSFASLKENVEYLKNDGYAILVRLTDFTKQWQGPFVYISKAAYDFLKKSSLQKGDLIMSNVGETGKVFILPELNKPASLGPNSILIRPNETIIDKEYLYYYFISNTGQLQIKKISSATTQSKFNKTAFRAITLTLPELSEQKQIVSKIKEYFTLLDTSEKELKQAEEKSNKIAKSFLHRAYVKNIANHPSCTLKDACTRITDGSHFSPKTIPSGYPYITVRDLNEVGIDFQNCKMISEESYTNLVKLGCKPEYGDVLFSKDGTVGKVAKVPENKDFVVLSSLAIITPNKEILSTDFLELLLSTPEVLNQAIKKKTGTAIRRITLTNLKEITIPIPPIQIQNDIYTEYLKYQMIGKKNMSFLIRSRDRLELLRQSILKKAFEGKLI